MKPLVSTEWLNQHLEDPDLVILDASTKELDKAQIPGALHFDLARFRDSNSDLPNTFPSPTVFEKEARKLGINNRSTVIIYDNLGIYTSPRVWWLFKTMGHDKVAVLDGGLPKWIGEGLSVTSSHSQGSKSGDFIAELKPQMVSSLDQVSKNLKTHEAIVLDARSSGRFNGTAPEPREGLRGGHIPNSLNLPFTKVLDDTTFKKREELKTLFQHLKLEDKPLIFSCGSGITACIILLASELVLDNKKSVFDGSWTEWALAEHLPAEP